MPTTNVTWYSLGFNIVDKQGYLYYGLEGDSSAQQVFLTAQELTALAQMFRDGGQVVFNKNGGQVYFVTERRDIVALAQADPAPPGHHRPRPRLHLPRVRPPTVVDGRAPPAVLDPRSGAHQLRERLPAVPVSPLRDPPGAMAGADVH